MRTSRSDETSSASPWRTQDAFEGSSALPKRFIARQPILDRSCRTFGYELLFRQGWANSFSGDAEAATRTVIDSTLVFGLETLIDQTVPFINCTHSALVDDLASMLPKGSVLEVLENTVIDDALLAACRRLQTQGYRIALDDFDFDPRWEPMLQFADFVKVDFLVATPEQRKRLVRQISRRKTLLIAEKIESEKEFRVALDEGFHLFQGYFFAKPTVVARPAMGILAKKLQLVAMVQREELQTEQILNLLKQETSIALRLLRLANSAAMGARDRIFELRTALALVGQERFRQLALATLVAEMNVNQVPELQRSILQRGRFCEGMADDLGYDPSQLFLLGIFSLLQPMLRLTRDEIREIVPLEADLMDALFGTRNSLRILLDALAHCDDGSWSQFSSEAQELALPELKLAHRCHLAQHWASQVVATATATM